MYRVLFLLWAGCGRVAFDGITDAAGASVGDGSSSTSSDGSTVDAFASCAGGDDICAISCVGSDPDCATTCGDTVCVGNAGELCGNCPGDCATRNVVCGNAACEPGEEVDCYADCGPVPWPWDGEEQQILASINTARTSGIVCPGGGGTQTGPAYTRIASIDAVAREQVWEVAHHSFVDPGNAACNGRSFAERVAPVAATDDISSAAASPAAFTTQWMGNTQACNLIMNAARTEIGIGGAHDAMQGYVIILR